MFQEINYRKLTQDDAADMYSIEAAIVNRNQLAVTLGHFRPRNRGQFIELLAPSSPINFTGAFKDNTLVGFGAFMIPQNPHILNEWHHEYACPLEQIRRRVSIPVSDDGPTGMLMSLRVHPQHQKFQKNAKQQVDNSIGSGLVAKRLELAFGLNSKVGNRAAVMITDVAASNLATIKAQYKAASILGTSAFIHAAGYDSNADNAPGLVVMHTTSISYESLSVVHTVPQTSVYIKDTRYAGSFARFAGLLEQGFIAWPDHGNSAQVIKIAKRPKCLKVVTNKPR